MNYAFGFGIFVISVWLSWHVSPLVGLGFLCIAVPILSLVSL